MVKCCGVCEYYNKMKECHRNPPNHLGFPKVNYTDFCGEFKEKTLEMLNEISKRDLEKI
jgi:hypothetical protein